MDKETLDGFGLPIGIVKENVTVEGLDLSTVQAGNVFFIGDEVTLEATGPCEPCTRMDEIRPGLRETLDGRRGIITMVLNGGTLRVNDTVRVEPSREALLTEAAG
jgi:MOSC domain-containing protein YiiM